MEEKTDRKWAFVSSKRLGWRGGRIGGRDGVGMDYGVAWVGDVRARRETVLSNHRAVTAVGNVADKFRVLSQERNYVGNYECNDDMFLG